MDKGSTGDVLFLILHKTEDSAAALQKVYNYMQSRAARCAVVDRKVSCSKQLLVSDETVSQAVFVSIKR